VGNKNPLRDNKAIKSINNMWKWTNSVGSSYKKHFIIFTFLGVLLVYSSKFLYRCLFCSVAYHRDQDLYRPSYGPIGGSWEMYREAFYRRV